MLLHFRLSLLFDWEGEGCWERGTDGIGRGGRMGQFVVDLTAAAMSAVSAQNECRERSSRVRDLVETVITVIM